MASKGIQYIINFIDKYSKTANDYVKSFSMMEKATKQVQGAIDTMPESIAGLQTRLQALTKTRDNAFSQTEIKKYNTEIAGLENQIRQLQGVSNNPIRPPVDMSGLQKMRGFVMNLLATLGIFSSLTMAISFGNESIDYAAKISDGMASVAKTTGMADDKMLQFRKNLQGLNTRTNLEDLLKIGEIGGQIGIGEKDILGFTKTIDQLNIAFKGQFAGGVEEITNKIGGLATMFPQLRASGMGVAEIISRIGSSMNELDASGKASAPFMSDFVSRAAPAFKALNPETLLGWAAGMQEMNMTSENAASGARGFFQYVFKDSEKFASVMKMNKAEMLNMFNTDEGTQRFLVNFGKIFKTMDVVQSRLVLQDLGVKDMQAQDFIQNIMTLQNTKGTNDSSISRIEEIISIGRVGMQENISITKEFDKMNNTLAAQIDKANKKYDESKLKLGEMLAPLKLQAMELGSILLDKVIGVFQILESKRGLFESLAVGAGVFAGAMVIANIPAMALAATQLAISLTNPFTLTIMGALALAGVISYLYYSSETFRGVLWAIYEGGKVVFEGLYNVGNTYIGGLIDIVGGLLKMWVGVFETVKAIFSLDFSKAGEGLSKIGDGWKQGVEGMFRATFGTLITGVGETITKTPKLIDAVDRGYTNGVNDFRTDTALGGTPQPQAAQKPMMGLGNLPNGLGLGAIPPVMKGVLAGDTGLKSPQPKNAMPSVPDSTSTNMSSSLPTDDNSNIKQGIDTISGGGSKPTTINITIGKLNEQIIINTTNLDEGSVDVEAKLTEIMLRVVNNANQGN